MEKQRLTSTVLSRIGLSLYNNTLRLATPWLIGRLFWRARYNPAYRQRIRERFGYYNPLKRSPIWVHAVSVGEVGVASALIEQLLDTYPDQPILVTTITPTGAEHLSRLLGDRVQHLYLPYDQPGAMKRFFKRCHPKFGIIMETELWPNMIRYAKKFRCPLLLANARLSESSFKGYYRIRNFIQPLIENFVIIAARGEQDATHFKQLGARADKITVIGDMKYDVSIPRDVYTHGNLLSETFPRDANVWLAASTHPGEEEQVLKAHLKVLQRLPGTLLILAPRHPERTERVIALCNEAGLKTERYSTLYNKEQRVFGKFNSNVLVVDVIGQLRECMIASDVVFVGGSLVPHGGHNILEPVALERPTLTGPHMHNFTEITQEMRENHGIKLCDNADALAENLVDLLLHPEQREALAKAALSVYQRKQGAVDKMLKLIVNVSRMVGSQANR